MGEMNITRKTTLDLTLDRANTVSVDVLERVVAQLREANAITVQVRMSSPGPRAEANDRSHLIFEGRSDV